MACRDVVEFGATETEIEPDVGVESLDHGRETLLRQLGRPLSQLVLAPSKYDTIVCWTLRWDRKVPLCRTVQRFRFSGHMEDAASSACARPHFFCHAMLVSHDT